MAMEMPTNDVHRRRTNDSDRREQMTFAKRTNDAEAQPKHLTRAIASI